MEELQILQGTFAVTLQKLTPSVGGRNCDHFKTSVWITTETTGNIIMCKLYRQSSSITWMNFGVYKMPLYIGNTDGSLICALTALE